LSVLKSNGDSEINVEVVDRGVGISEEDQKNLFKPQRKINSQ